MAAQLARGVGLRALRTHDPGRVAVIASANRDEVLAARRLRAFHFDGRGSGLRRDGHRGHARDGREKEQSCDRAFHRFLPAVLFAPECTFPPGGAMLTASYGDPKCFLRGEGLLNRTLKRSCKITTYDSDRTP